MDQVRDFVVGDNPNNNKQWRKIYILGGLAAFLAFLLTLTDIVFGSISSGNLSQLPNTAIERFYEFQQNSLFGLYHLDLLNVINSIIMVPLYFALFAVHRKSSLPFAAFALVTACIGSTVFVSTNTALPMLELSRKYFAAGDETYKTLIAAAGEALISRGEHGSLGVLIGFTLSTLSSILMSFVMLNGRIFNKVVSYLGIIGNILLLTYILLVTFVPAIKNTAAAIAAPGGLAALAWLFMTGVKLIKQEKTENIKEGC